MRLNEDLNGFQRLSKNVKKILSGNPREPQSRKNVTI